MRAKDRIIVAVDVNDPRKALELVRILGPLVGSFKIGLELITALLLSVLTGNLEEAGKNLAVIREFFSLIREQVFWDGKFDDIPQTVAKVSQLVGQTLNVRMFNVHASCTIRGMMAAVANKGKSRVLAVTVLTSTDDATAIEVFGAPSQEKVLRFARDAKLAGCDGVVCSPLELVMLEARPELQGFWKVTPGIRGPNDPIGDQKRTLSPQDAIIAGAYQLVIGRPITGAASPAEAVKAIAAEIERALIMRFFLSLFVQEKIKFGAFKLRHHQDFPTAPLSPIFLNIRELPQWMYDLAADILHDLIVREGVDDFDYVVGIPKAGEPIGIALAKTLGKPHLRIEKKEDASGRHITSTILDPFEKGRKALIVDDLITFATTKREAIASVEANGLVVTATLVLCDRGQGGLAELNGEGRKVCAAATLDGILSLYVEGNKIDANKAAEVRNYIALPPPGSAPAAS